MTVFETRAQFTPSRHTVGQGMVLYARQTDRFKVGLLSMSMAKQTEAARVPPTSLLLSTLKRGTEKYPSLAAINERLDNLYASSLVTRNYRCGDRQILGISTEFLDSRYLNDPEAGDILDGCAEMMSQMLLHPLTEENGLLCARLVDSEKVHLCDSIRSQQNNPRLWAALRFAEVLCANEPCGIPLHGGVDQIMSLTREQLRACHRDWLDSSELIFFYIGPEEPARVAEVLCRRFADFRPITVEQIPPTTVIRRADKVRSVTEEMAVSQGKLHLGFRTDATVHDPTYYAMAMANEVFGASPASKLFMTVREEKSLCYSIGSSYDLYKGIMKVSCGIDPDMKDVACEEIMRQWDRMRRGEITDEELHAAKQSLENNYRTIEDNPHAIEGFYYGRLLEGVDMTVEDCRAGLAAVTREQIVEAASAVTLDTVYFLKGTCPDGGEEADEDGELE
ncbi:MAG: insulinase family protein [Clostridia bacterium]|nr:insulinase family protein [Clostridia bacterium]